MNSLHFLKIHWGVVIIFLLLPCSALSAQNKKKVVVLDAGHGGRDPGKVYKNYKEKNIALSIVLKAGRILQKRNFKVVYTRTKDVFVDLKQRGAIANKSDADLFVSIHCNAHHTQAVGAETWVLATSANRKNFEVAKAENEVIFLEENYQEKYKGFDPNLPTSTIGLTIEQEENLDQSILLASLVQNQFRNKLKRIDRGVKQNVFVVLHQTYMPSILIEAGFITNRKEGRYLHSQKGKLQIALSIANAITEYFRQMQAGYIITDVQLPKKKAKNQIYYKIQIASSSKKVEVKFPNFKGLVKERVKVGKFYKYYSEKVDTYDRAKILLKKIRAKGHKSAFIAAFKNGDKISISKALKEQKK